MESSRLETSPHHVFLARRLPDCRILHGTIVPASATAPSPLDLLLSPPEEHAFPLATPAMDRSRGGVWKALNTTVVSAGSRPKQLWV